MDIKEYNTIEKNAVDEFIEKKSRFIGYACPVKTEQEAKAFIAEIKSKHWNATHNVSAFVLRDNNIQRSSDDGEPSGTAGVPVLNVLLKENLVDVCVVATRYFGGILLGAGGLVRAYGHTAKIAIDAAGIITMALCKIMTVGVDYNFYERILLLLSEYNANIENTDFAEKVNITFSIKANVVDLLRDSLTDVSNGKYQLSVIGEKFAKV